MSDITLSNLVASRICHDLAGPLGALLNGIELIRDDDDPDMREAAIDLLVDSLHQATSKLKLYRLAFGASGGDSQPVSLIEGRAAAVDYFQVGRTKFDWDPAGTKIDELPKNLLRLLLNLILVAETGAPRGGVLSVQVLSGDPGGLRVTVDGDRLALPEEIRNAIRGGEMENFEARFVAAMLAAKLAAVENREIAVEIGENHISISA